MGSGHCDPALGPVGSVGPGRQPWAAGTAHGGWAAVGVQAVGSRHGQAEVHRL